MTSLLRESSNGPVTDRARGVSSFSGRFHLRLFGPSLRLFGPSQKKSRLTRLRSDPRRGFLRLTFPSPLVVFARPRGHLQRPPRPRSLPKLTSGAAKCAEARSPRGAAARPRVLRLRLRPASAKRRASRVRGTVAAPQRVAVERQRHHQRLVAERRRGDRGARSAPAPRRGADSKAGVSSSPEGTKGPFSSPRRRGEDIDGAFPAGVCFSAFAVAFASAFAVAFASLFTSVARRSNAVRARAAPNADAGSGVSNPPSKGPPPSRRDPPADRWPPRRKRRDSAPLLGAGRRSSANAGRSAGAHVISAASAEEGSVGALADPSADPSADSSADPSADSSVDSSAPRSAASASDPSRVGFRLAMTTARDCAPGGGARGSTTDPPGTAKCAAHVAGGWEDPEGPPPNVGRTSVELRGGFGFVSAAAPPGGGSVAEARRSSPPRRSPRAASAPPRR